jgi:hypothetical protein
VYGARWASSHCLSPFLRLTLHSLHVHVCAGLLLRVLFALSRSTIAVASEWGIVAVLRSVLSGVICMRLPIASQYGVFFNRVASLGIDGELSFK